jgi:superfamily II DNA/RNA helicase
LSSGFNVFEVRDRLISDFSDYISGFISIRDPRIRDKVESEFERGLLWPDPLIQLNPSFERGGHVTDLVDQGLLHPECARVFSRKETQEDTGTPLRLYRHQVDAIQAATTGGNYVLTTGTGSGKSLAYIIPIVDHVLKNGSGKGIQAIVVYPMNALANSQDEELRKFLCFGYPGGIGPVSFRRYTGQERRDEREEIQSNPPDILLTNYVMLDLLLTRRTERRLVDAAKGLRFLVLDELHTYRGRQGADVAMLVRRVRETTGGPQMQCVGTSATMASEGDYDQQRARVAEVAGAIFGSSVLPQHVIGETLERVTPEEDATTPAFVDRLCRRLTATDRAVPSSYHAFINDPLSIWIESTLGVQREPESDRLVRAKPISITGPAGAALRLSKLTGVDVAICTKAIEEQLAASYLPGNRQPDTGTAPFAFRLHQFISRGGSVYASLQSAQDRWITLQGQQYVPGDRSHLLYPVVFCRECGHEFYSVTRVKDSSTGAIIYRPRAFGDRAEMEEAEEEEPTLGYLSIDDANPWPEDLDQIVQRVPEDWVESGKWGIRVKRNYRGRLPQTVEVSPGGNTVSNGEGASIRCLFIASPFQFCTHCGVQYVSGRGKEYWRLATLATEGRSSATTVISLSAVRALRSCNGLHDSARKLLSFSDNRQDASLQAGHFNDFVQTGLVRAALYEAVKSAGSDGLMHDELPFKVFEALNLPFRQYAGKDPDDVPRTTRQKIDSTFRDVLEYIICCDQERGWRVQSPSLEQCGLLKIEYMGLDEICANERLWKDLHPVVADACPAIRQAVCTTLLEHMRRAVSIDVGCLDPDVQKRIASRSSQHLVDPWDVEPEGSMRCAPTTYPRARLESDSRGCFTVSARSVFGRYLRRRDTFGAGPQLNQEECLDIIRQLMRVLSDAGVLEAFPPERHDPEGTPGYRVKASAIVWKPGDGSTPTVDPLYSQPGSAGHGRVNPFFLHHYTAGARQMTAMEAREHTAQVASELRQEREARFRTGELPVMYCSPTMELGVDIRDLNAVNMRNVPPTPANYAQRSGRAGRSGQPAIVVTYCSSRSSHDQHFFRNPAEMVAGSVLAPRIDLANEDLVRAHVHAILVSEAQLDLGDSMSKILDVSGDNPWLSLNESIAAALSNRAVIARTKKKAQRVLEATLEHMGNAHWYSDRWIDDTLDQALRALDRACDRWRDLYRAAKFQLDEAHRIRGQVTIRSDQRKLAKKLYEEADAQIQSLSNAEDVRNSDFYSYRYLASEGFLPGYSFPRLPLSAFMPGRKDPSGRSELISRPRFLAISEFGPGAIIYHEGSRYKIHKVILPPREIVGDQGVVRLSSVKQCARCGYIQSTDPSDTHDICAHCGCKLGAAIPNAFRMANVVARRVDRISSDEEERQRLGYELSVGFQYAVRGGAASCRRAHVVSDAGHLLAELTYAPGATIYRINLGWANRKEHEADGYELDVIKGNWVRSRLRGALTKDADDEEGSGRICPVVPYVEDTKNCLVFTPANPFTASAMATLQAALKSAIQLEYQLEDSELAAEPMPSRRERDMFLFYEAAEGGAGVLRRLLDDPAAMGRVARRALEVCHYDPETLDDEEKDSGREDRCEAACYDCLMSYGNQLDHEMLDRQLLEVVGFLAELREAGVESSPTPAARGDHLGQLLGKCESQLERRWLDFMNNLDLRLPSDAQVLIDEAATRVDFYYAIDGGPEVAVYVDGPVHDMSDKKRTDAAQEEALRNLGIMTVRFRYDEDWSEVVRGYSGIFGEASTGGAAR